MSCQNQMKNFVWTLPRTKTTHQKREILNYPTLRQLFMLLKRPRCQNIGDKSGLFVTIHFFVWTVLRTLLLTLLNLWAKYWIFNKAICGCEIYILTVNFSKIFLHIADLNFLPMKKLAQSILRCKFPLYIRPSKRAFEKYKPQGFNIFHFTVIKSWPQLFKSWMALSTR